MLRGASSAQRDAGQDEGRGPRDGEGISGRLERPRGALTALQGYQQQRRYLENNKVLDVPCSSFRMMSL